jgi:curved DNA-binding protein CbpA
MAPKGRTDYYALLGVVPGSTFRQISDAYWSLAAEKRDELPLLNAAYEVLSNPARRDGYDSKLREEPAQPGPAPASSAPSAPVVRAKLNWYLR